MSYYHVIVTAYGQWLRGDARGWRERHHRKHVDGDYKNPPLPEESIPVAKYSVKLMTELPTKFRGDCKKLILESLQKKLEMEKVGVFAMSVDNVHVHILADYPSNDVRQITGRAKKHASFIMHDNGFDGQVWAKKCGITPIKDAGHLQNVWNYIIRHRNQGACVYYRPLQT